MSPQPTAPTVTPPAAPDENPTGSADVAPGAPDAPASAVDAPAGVPDAQAGADSATPPGESDPDADTADAGSRANREAAARRVQLRETEAERDALHVQVTGLQRSLIEYRIEHDTDLPYLHRSADLFDVANVALSDLLDDDGEIDPGKLSAALESVRAERPYLIGTRPSAVDPLYAAMQRQTHTVPAAQSFEQALTGAIKKARTGG